MRASTRIQALLLGGVLTLPACGPTFQAPPVSPGLIESERLRQKEEMLKAYFERIEQVARVTNLIAAKNVELCDDQTEPHLGIFWADKKMITEEYWDVAERVFGIGDNLRVLAVVPGFPAEAAGVKPGDVVLKINDSEIVSASAMFDKTSKSDRAREMLRNAGMEPAVLEITRTGEPVKLTVYPIPACTFSAKVAIKETVNAFADGNTIAVTTGMLRFVKSDDELAVVLGHELAHNILAHPTKGRGSAIAGGFLGLLLDAAAAAGGVNTGGLFSQWGAQAGRLMFSKDYEREADYLGLYFAARAGFDPSRAPDLWRRMAIEHPASIKDNFLATHPSTPERAATLQATVQEINNKLRSETSLLPSRKVTWQVSDRKADKPPLDE